MQRSCENCSHSNMAILDGGEPVLKCYRYPPQLFIEADGGLAQAVPEATHVCGEHNYNHDVGFMIKRGGEQ